MPVRALPLEGTSMRLQLPDRSMNWERRPSDLISGQVDCTFELSYQPRKGKSMAMKRRKNVAMTAKKKEETNTRGRLRTKADMNNVLSHVVHAPENESKETSSKSGCNRFRTSYSSKDTGSAQNCNIYHILYGVGKKMGNHMDR